MRKRKKNKSKEKWKTRISKQNEINNKKREKKKISKRLNQHEANTNRKRDGIYKTRVNYRRIRATKITGEESTWS